MLVLGIETGVHGTRGIVLDLEAARVVFDAGEGLQTLDGLPDGHREQDPAQWIASVDRVARRCVEAVGDQRGRLLAMGVAGPSQGLVVLDGENRIVRPAKIAGDRSAWRQADAMLRAFGGAPGLLELTGNGLLPSHAGPGILWLKQHEPYHFQRVAALMLPHDFVGYWLTAERRCGHASASVTGLFDVASREWCRELVDWLDPRLTEMLPHAVPDLEPQGMLRRELAEAWGLPADVLVAAGLPDTVATVTGAGCVAAGDLMVSLGIGAELACVSEAATIDTRGEVAALCDASGAWLAALSMTSGAAAPDLIRRHYGWSAAEFESMVGTAPAGAGGLLFLPYLEGERTPALPDGCGVLHGVSSDNFTPVNLARAAVEGVAAGIGYGLSRLRDLGLTPAGVRAAGVAAASPLWRQLLADISGLPVTGVGGYHGAAFGAALQAAAAYFRQSGESLSLAEIATYAVEPGEATRCEPDAERHEVYQELVSRQQYLVDTLHPAGFL